MRKTLLVAKREYLERVRSKSFWFMVLGLPFGLLFVLSVPLLVSMVNPEQQQRVALIDPTGRLLDPANQIASQNTLKNGDPAFVFIPVSAKEADDKGMQQLRRSVLAGELFAIAVVHEASLNVNRYRLYMKNTGDVRSIDKINTAMSGGLTRLRVERKGLTLSRESLMQITAPGNPETFQIRKGGGEQKRGSLGIYAVTYLFGMVLYSMLLIYGFAVASSVIREKKQRVMEVLMGALTPSELMNGKIIGVGLVGLTHLGIYGAMAACLRLLSGIAVSHPMVESKLKSMAEMPYMDLTGALEVFSVCNLAYFAIFFLVGYVMFTCLFAILGVACDSEDDIRNLNAPATMFLIVPALITVYFVAQPDSTAAQIASMFPLLTPTVMFMRVIVLQPPAWQVGLSLLLSFATILLFFRGADRVFRIGTLMYGKNPRFREILRWART
jgi:ABC-2 type transport system permease protein